MLSPSEIEKMAELVLRCLEKETGGPEAGSGTVKDGSSISWENEPALERMKERTKARIGVGKAGPRLRTETFLKLRADHAVARDAVLLDVSEDLV